MTRQVTIHGIRNCDTMKKARAWLEENGIPHAFHDYKAAGLDRAMLDRWLGQVPWETLLNRAGTTFRKLPDAKKEGLDRDKAVALMLDQPSVVKRPVLEVDGKVTIGFAPAAYAALFGR
jgi:Spx/MgsR family transcriptional regulator